MQNKRKLLVRIVFFKPTDVNDYTIFFSFLEKHLFIINPQGLQI